MALIRGRVIDYDTDAPLSNVLVQGVAKNGTVFASGNTDNNGGFNIDHAGFDDLYAKITFDKDGYASQSMRPASANDTDVVLPKAGTLSAVTLTLKQNKTKVLLWVAVGALLVFLYFKYKNKIPKL
jgi:hypothetical protein